MTDMMEKPKKVPYPSDLVTLELYADGVGILSMTDRVGKNLFSKGFIDAVSGAFDKIWSMPEWKVVVLTGFGHYFASGGDKDGLLQIYNRDAVCTDGVLHAVPLDFDLPVIAAMQGHAVGSGWIMGMACDFTIFSKESIYRCPFMSFGFTPGAGATVLFPERFGPLLGREILFGGRAYKGKELAARGISFPVLPRDEVLGEALALARKLGAHSRATLVERKRGATASLRQRVSEVFRDEIAMHDETFVGKEEVLRKILREFGDDAVQVPGAQERASGPEATPARSIKAAITDLLAESLGVGAAAIDQEASFASLGLDSVLGVAFVDAVNEAYGTKLKASIIYQASSVALLAEEVGRRSGIDTGRRQDEASEPLPTYQTGEASLVGRISKILAEEIDKDAGDIDPATSFASAGLDSIIGVNFVERLNRAFALGLRASDLYRYSTVAALAEHIAETYDVDFAAEAERPPAQAPVAPSSVPSQTPSRPDAEPGTLETLSAILARELDRAASELDPDASFQTLGLDSILGVEFVGAVNEAFGAKFKASAVYEYPSLRAMADFIAQPGEEQSIRTEERMSPALGDDAAVAKRRERADQPMGREPEAKTKGIAIIGMSGRFPMAQSLEAFWDNLVNGRDCVQAVPEDRWPLRAYYSPDEPGKSYSKWMGILEGGFEFDPFFFGLTPAEAASMDPQERLLLQAAWHAIEDAGYAASSLSGSRCGVFIGVTPASDYTPAYREPRALGLNGAVTGSTFSGRISHFLNFQGPSVAIDTACSSSLVAVAAACDSLAMGHADIAIAGGCSVLATPRMHEMTSQAGMLSRGGRCRAFDEGADGFVPGEGVGMVVLKPLDQAQEAADEVLAVIDAWGVNHDGRTNGLTAPNPAAQTGLQKNVYERFGIDPRGISFIEAHGTGTVLGDPIEVEALQASLDADGEGLPCALGTVKSNLGHLLAAAGMAGLIKTVLSLKHQLVPPTLHVEDVNPHIDLTNSRLRLAREVSDWVVPEGQGRLAAVSAFGLAGTNAHIVLAEQGESGKSMPPVSGPFPFVLSAKNLSSLRALSRAFAQHACTDPYKEKRLDEIAYSLQIGREPFRFRLAVFADDAATLRQKLGEYAETGEAKEGLFISDIRTAERSTGLSGQDHATFGLMADYTERWLAGHAVQWRDCWPEGNWPRRKLPLYPFERREFAPVALLTEEKLPHDDPSNAGALPMGAWPDFAGAPKTVTVHPRNHLDQAADARQREIYLFDLPALFGQTNARPRVAIHRLTSKGHGDADRFTAAANLLFARLKAGIDQEIDRRTVQVVVPREGGLSPLIGLVGILNALHIERPSIRVQLIVVEESDPPAGTEELLDLCARSRLRGVLTIQRSDIHAVGWERIECPERACYHAWKPGGVYVITGGLGGLGRIFASDALAHCPDAKIYLIGRRDLDDEMSRALRALGGEGRAEYIAADIADERGVASLIEKILRRHGRIDGIVHSAGVIRDNFFAKKSWAEFETVMSPKVRGTINLDTATAHLELDFFCCFSSGAGVLGNIGQADYSAANAFMDSFVHRRRRRVEKGERQGKSVTLNWPLWDGGGMGVDDATASALSKTLGMRGLTAPEGLAAFHYAIEADQAQLLVMSGDADRLSDWLQPVATAEGPQAEATRISQTEVIGLLTDKLKELYSDVTGIDAAELDTLEPLESYGIDSIKVTGLNQELAEVFPEMPRTLFFECGTLDAAARRLAALFPQEASVWSEGEAGLMVSDQGQADDFRVSASRRSDRAPVAVIGMAGRFPGAPDMDGFWSLLAKGDSAVRKIETDRWVEGDLYESDPDKADRAGRSYGQWAGMLTDAECFDPLFFGLSPRIATMIDPQERIFLECCWHALEHAGYGPSLIDEVCDRSVGVFVGITKTGYELHGPAIDGQSEPLLIPQTSFSSAANRVSYFLDLTGPSLPVDTMCSSSLSAIHLACDALHAGDCRMALAGGVNLYLHPRNFAVMSAQRMLSPSGRCATFSHTADGFVPGEGVGVVCLKPLAAARRDGDRIDAVILGSSIGHGGRTNGYTVPDPAAQGRVVAEAMEKAGIGPSEIGYIEAHGTGTRLGDPIEIRGLNSVFAEGYEKGVTSPVPIGSVKTNIGHLEAAAGIAGLIKIILQMKNETIAPSLHAEDINPDIDFASSPIRVQRETAPWPRSEGGRRIAGLSSFGAGGANAHIIIAEPEPEPVAPDEVPHPGDQELLIVSAKTASQLQTLLVGLGRHLAEKELPLAPVAATLQLGRGEFDWRVGIIAGDAGEASRALIEAAKCPDRFSRVSTRKDERAERVKEASFKAALQTALDRRDLPSLRDMWLEGLDIPFTRLWPRRPAPTPLVSYPFERQRLWLPDGRLASRPEPERADNSSQEQGADKTGLQLLTPVWEVLPEAEGRTRGQGGLLITVGLDPDEETLLSGVSRADEVVALECGCSDLARDFLPSAAALFTAIKNNLGRGTQRHRTIRIIARALSGETSQISESLNALCKVVANEDPTVATIFISVGPERISKENAGMLCSALPDGGGRALRLTERGLERRLLVPQEKAKADHSWRWRDDGVYLISGGAGGMGVLLARRIGASCRRPNIILCGRRGSPELPSDLAQGLRAKGAKIEYLCADVTKPEEAEALVTDVAERFGSLNGVFHFAGKTDDSYIAAKTQETFEAVLSPKIRGALNLDRATWNVPLDAFVLASSLSAELGNIGQADYAVANAFMNEFAAFRARLAASGMRSGRTLSVAWPLWREGGMGIDEAVAERMKKAGIRMLDTDEAFDALEHMLASPEPYIAVLPASPETAASLFATPPAVDEVPLREELEAIAPPALVRALAALVAPKVGLSAEAVDPLRPVADYGLDSVVVTRLNDAISERLGRISQTLFFQGLSLQEIADALWTEHREKCREWIGTPHEDQTTEAKAAPEEAPRARRAWTSEARKETEKFAIVALTGRYPGAEDLRDFWSNLKAGKDCITQVPEERWSMDDGFFESDPVAAAVEGKSYGRWGGFLSEAARFDPYFFGIAPREARNMDPHERLFLETCWNLLEDGGYTPERLRRVHHRRVGVFVGVTKIGYCLYSPEHWAAGGKAEFQTSFASIANRVSFLFDLQGPSMPIDTMCSSSLVAVHTACRYLAAGECDAAIVGGVNLYLHPANYVALSGQRMLSTDGRCASFGEGGDGFVPGEGVGACLIKTLSRAERDGDAVLSVIAGSAVNHGGLTNGYTVPNPKAQARLIGDALDAAGLPAESLSYIEAHGTGTALGDPIEIEGLAMAFREKRCTSDSAQLCSIGSLKSNIGHLEAAAGIAGLTKTVLQLQNRTLVPSLHAETVNRRIDLGPTPFRIQRECAAWAADAEPRRAGVSSFGAGGANAHVVLEEYCSDRSAAKGQGPALILLSATSVASLRDRVLQLCAWLDDRDEGSVDLHRLAYTLQLGRVAMDVRLCVVAECARDLRAALLDWAEGRALGPNTTVRLPETVSQNSPLLHSVPGSDGGVREAWRQGDLTALAARWIDGENVPWHVCYDAPLIPYHLPHYRFSGQIYWVPPRPTLSAKPAQAGSSSHPMLLETTPEEKEIRQRVALSSTNWWISDHTVGGRQILPGVAHLELALGLSRREAEPTPRDVIQLRNIVWVRPIIGGDGAVFIEREDAGPDRFTFRCVGSSGSDDLYSQGEVVRYPNHLPPLLDLDRLRADAKEVSWSRENVYQRYDRAGLRYGPAMKGIERLHKGRDDRGRPIVLAEIRQPEEAAPHSQKMTLNPSLLDAAFQASIGLFAIDDESEAVLPFAADSVVVYGRPPTTLFAWCRSSEDCADNERVDIDLCSVDGVVAVQVTGLTFRRMGGKGGDLSALADRDSPLAAQTRYLKSIWTKIEREDAFIPVASRERPVLALAGTADRAAALEHILGVEAILLRTPYEIGETHFETSLQRDTPQCIVWAPDPVPENLTAGSTPSLGNLLALQAFDMVKSLLTNGYATQEVELCVITQGACGVDSHESVSAVHAGIHGFFGSIAKEYPHWRIVLVDIGAGESLASAFDGEGRAPLGLPSGTYAQRGGSFYVQEMQECSVPERCEPSFPRGGVAVIIGGAGGLGRVLTDHIIGEYEGHVVWIGRRPEVEVQPLIENMSKGSGQLEYIQADAADALQLARTAANIEARHGRIDRVVHAALVLEDASIERMERATFMRVMSVKAETAVNMARAFSPYLKGDFVFFSSVQSVAREPGQSNYAAGCAYKDAVARQLDGDDRYTVKIINWGYWDEVGAVADDFYRERLRRRGVVGIKGAEAMEAFERILSSDEVALGFIKTIGETYKKPPRPSILAERPRIPAE